MGSSKLKLSSLGFISVIALAGCGGGGGGAGTSATLSAFTRISDITAGSTVRVPGMSTEATYVSNGTAVTSLSAPSAVTTSTTVDASYSSTTGLLNRLAISTPTSSVTFSEAAGDTFGTLIGSSGTIGAVVNSTGSALAAYPFDPANNGWDYQTFGVWQSGRGTSSGRVGAVSLGAETGGSGIPSSGTATYQGYAGGSYLESNGITDYLTRATATLQVNFATRAIAFQTSSTVKAPMTNIASATADSNLNLSGTLNWNAGVNQFTGAVTATGLTGTATGRFYGPNAVEAGGVFALSGAGVSGYMGAFGAVRGSITP